MRTGVIRLVTYPSNAKVFINGSDTGDTTPVVFSGLRRGIYRVRAEKTGYETWQTEVGINPPEAKVIDPLILIPKRKQFDEITSVPFHNLLPVLKTDYILLLGGRKIQDVRVYNLDKESVELLASPASGFDNDEIVDIFTHSHDTRVIFRIKHNGDTLFLVRDLKDEDGAFEDVTSLFVAPDKTSEVFWDSHENRYLFIQRDDDIDRIDLGESSRTTRWSENVFGFGAEDNEAFILKQNTLISRKITDPGEAEIDLIPAQLLSLFDRSSHYKIEKLKGGIFLFISNNGDFITSKLPYRITDEKVRGFEIERNKRLVLIWTNHKIGVIDFKTTGSDETPFEQGPSVRWIYTDASRIETAYFAHNASHILFQDKDRVFLMRTTPYADEKPAEFFKVWKKSLFYYAERKGGFYFLDSRNAHLISWKLIPEEDLLEFLRLSGEESLPEDNKGDDV